MNTPTKNHETVLRMINEQSACWSISGERLEAFEEIPVGMPPHHRETLEKMKGLAVDGATTWTCTVDRHVALRSYVEYCVEPSRETIRGVLESIQIGALQDRVIDREWVQETIKLLHRLSQTSSG